MTRKERFKELALKHQLTLAIFLTVVIACIMTSVSLYLYSSSGAIQLDLSRPAYEAARKEIVNPRSDNDFSTTGAVSKEELDTYQKLFDDQRKDLNSFGRFKDKGLDDESLGLSADTTQ